MNISTFRRNAYRSIEKVRKAQCLMVTSRSGLAMSVCLYTNADADFVQSQWTVMANASSAHWASLLHDFGAFVITVDGSPKLVVMQWTDDDEQTNE